MHRHTVYYRLKLHSIFRNIRNIATVFGALWGSLSVNRTTRSAIGLTPGRLSTVRPSIIRSVFTSLSRISCSISARTGLPSCAGKGTVAVAA